MVLKRLALIKFGYCQVVKVASFIWTRGLALRKWFTHGNPPLVEDGYKTVNQETTRPKLLHPQASEL